MKNFLNKKYYINYFTRKLAVLYNFYSDVPNLPINLNIQSKISYIVP